VFSDNSVVYRKEDYIHRIGPLYEQLVAHTAKAGLFESALHWLQQLLYKDVSDGAGGAYNTPAG